MQKRIVKGVAVCLFLFCSLSSSAQIQNDSCTLEISLLTCAPGTDLYSLFGHTAIRVRDQQRGMDVVYNYGTFDDSDPLFYFYFTRGIMVYSLSADTFGHFMPEYEEEHRGVTEQVLNLTCEQKKSLYEALRQNTTEENRYYHYHFYADNCTTRAGKIIMAQDASAVFQNILPNPSPSYREMIHLYLDRQQQWWAGFGIDMLLGGNLDKKPSNEQAIYFLPDYLMTGLDHAHTSTGPLVRKKQVLLQFPEIKAVSVWLTPFSFFTVLGVLVIGLSLIRKKAAQKAVSVFDLVLFSLLGLVGLVMLYVWIARVDTVCRNNINIFWAIPTHIVAVFFIRKNPFWLKYYFLIAGMLAALLLIGFPWWPQRMNSAVIPLLIIILFRSVHPYLKKDYAKDHPVSGSKSGL
jgi:hypothetical protein